jgi:hypothetical protein
VLPVDAIVPQVVSLQNRKRLYNESHLSDMEFAIG